jgi:hypothetical protein
MHKPQCDVVVFHLALDVPVFDTPAIRRPELRASLIEEEAKETVEAIRSGDLVEAIDGLCDLIYVAYGAANEFGVDLEPFWDEVQRSNMKKVGGSVREDGKRLKPPDWKPPDIAGVLEVMQNNREAIRAASAAEARIGRSLRRSDAIASWIKRVLKQ